MTTQNFLQVLKKNSDVTSKNIDLKQNIHKYHSAILSACPTKSLPNIEDLGKPPIARAPQPMMVPTAAALKMGVGFPLKNIPSGRGDRVLSSHANKGTMQNSEVVSNFDYAHMCLCFYTI